MRMSRCNTCELDAFPSVEDWKSHFKTDFHRYNLKRKIADLEPVSEETFKQKLQLILEAGKVAKGKDHLKPQSRHRTPVHTQINTKDVAVPSDADAEINNKLQLDSNNASSASVAYINYSRVYSPTMCLFDNTEHETVLSNLAHMEKRYNFFLPDMSYVKDVAALLRYIGQQLWEFHECLYCRHPFKSLASVRNHMLDTSHILLCENSTDLPDEYLKFYDFSSSYKELDPNATEDLVIKIKTLKQPVDLKLAAANDNDELPVDGDELPVDGDDNEGEWIDEETVDDKKWDGVIDRLGLRMANITETGHLQLPTGGEVAPRQLAYIYRQHIRRINEPEKSKLSLKDPSGKSTKNASDALLPYRSAAQLGNYASKQRFNSKWQRFWSLHPETRRAYHKISKQDVRLGVKQNKLSRCIKRDNLIII